MLNRKYIYTGHNFSKVLNPSSAVTCSVQMFVLEPLSSNNAKNSYLNKMCVICRILHDFKKALKCGHSWFSTELMTVCVEGLEGQRPTLAAHRSSSTLTVKKSLAER